MKRHLSAGEKIEADDGYEGEYPATAKIPLGSSSNPIEKALRSRVRNRHETANKVCKVWYCLAHVLKHGLLEHSSMFRAVAVICQVAIENGEPLFSVDYDDSALSLV